MSGELRNTFQEPEAQDRGSPRGLISAWSGGYFTDGSNGGYTNILGNTILDANTYLNPLGWWVCDGDEVNESDSPIFNGAGRHLPNLTGDRFLMGSTSAGVRGGSNALTDHTHTTSISATQAQHRHYHNHAAASTSNTGNHRHPLSSDLTKPNVLLNQFHYGTGSYAQLTVGGPQYYVRTHTAYAGNHSHTVDIPGMYSDYQTPAITVTGTVGTGSAASLTENRPQYLSCLYIIKVK